MTKAGAHRAFLAAAASWLVQRMSDRAQQIQQQAEQKRDQKTPRDAAAVPVEVSHGR